MYKLVDVPVGEVGLDETMEDFIFHEQSSKSMGWFWDYDNPGEVLDIDGWEEVL